MRESGTLHGNAPHQSRVAVLVVDMINDLDFEGGEALLEHARPVAEKIRQICDQARASNVPVVCVNDNHGLTGMTADSCVLFTAHDAYVRDYELVVPVDAVASIERTENERALAHMRSLLGARTPRTDELDLAALAREASLKV